MRKILFLSTLMLGLGLNSALAFITSASEIDVNKVYTLYSERGYMSYNGSNALKTETGTATDNCRFAFVEYGNRFYLYSVAAGKFIQAKENGYEFSDFSTSFCEFADGSANFPNTPIWLRLARRSLNCSTAGGFSINTWNSADNGDCYAINPVEGVSFDPTEAIASLENGLKSLTGKAFTLSCGRGGITMASGTLAHISTADINSSDINQQFAFILHNQNLYLYSIGKNGFVNGVTGSPTLSQDNGTVYNYAHNSTNNTIVFTINNTNTLNDNGSGTTAFDSWTQENDGNIFAINVVETFDDTEVLELLDNPLYEITYNVYYNGDIAESVTVNAKKGTKAEAPETILRDYVDLVCENTNITSAGQNIRVDATWNGPFELNADYASISKWYDMAVRGTWYVTSDNKDGDGALKTVNANAMGLAEDAYQWAFVGDPWHIQLYNKAYGDSKVYAWTSNGDGSIPAFVDPTTTNYWKIRKSTSSIENSFMLTTDMSYQVNQYGGAGGSLKVWAATGTHDDGSAFTVFDVPTNFSEYALAEIYSYLNGEYFVLNDALRSQVGWQDSFTTTCTFNEYKSMKEALSNIDLTNVNNYKMPETGFYRIKNRNYANNYMGQTGTLVVGNITGNNATGISTVIKLTKNTDGKYSIAVQGNYLQAAVKSTSVAVSNEPALFTPQVTEAGYGAFAVDPTDRYTFLHRRGEGDIVGWESSAYASQWVVEDAEDITLALHEGNAGEYWATLYAPFGVVLPTGTEAYVGKLSENSLSLISIGQNVPAGTPVILKGNAASITATINDEIAAISADNDLKGQYLAATAASETNLSLGKKDGKVGFYQYTDALGANKAYIVLPASTSSNGFTFSFADDDVTGIEAVNGQSSIVNNYYDLTGRKVAAPQKGQLYIKDGKVVKY